MPKRQAAGLICASGTLGQIIPPSILLVLLGDQIGNTYLEAQQRAAVEHARALRHQIVDLEADLDLRNTSAEALATKLAGLQSAFDAYGDVLTQEVGPQDTSGA